MMLSSRNSWVKGACCLAAGLPLMMVVVLMMVLTPQRPVSAAGPAGDAAQTGERRVAFVSTDVDCLVVNAGASESVSATVRLEWEGEIEEAFLVLAVAGSEGEHSMYINGQRVGSVPIRPEGRLCRPGHALPVWVSTDRIPVPVEVITSGENVITLTNDANINDDWAAANLYLEIHGALTFPPAAPVESVSFSHSVLQATDAVTGSVTLTSTYDGILHTVWYQVPVSYTEGISVPLVVVVHGMGGTGVEQIDGPMAVEANGRGWLMVAPAMHGSYYQNTGKYCLASPPAQHDIIDALEWALDSFAVDRSRIYIIGGSMGGQITAVMDAKYPDVFAAAVEWKGITDLEYWYYNGASGTGVIHNIENETGGTPTEKPFEYQRRSGMTMPQNARLVPLKIWHDEGDSFVQIHHSYGLRDAINGWNPPVPVTVTAVDTGLGHDYTPDPSEVFDFLESFILDSQPPPTITARTDESKPYYWINVLQTGIDHWSEVSVSRGPADNTVTAAISDTQPLTVAFNLGSTAMMGRVMERSGLGLPATTYLVKGGGNHRLEVYASGYLTTTMTSTGRFTLTISAIAVEVLAAPPMVSGERPATSTITARAKDQLGDPVPDFTVAQFSTTEGTFSNGRSTYTGTTTGGQATATLSLGSGADLAEITVTVESVTGSTTVDVIHSSIDVLVTPDQMTIESGQPVTYTYELTNTGDITLTAVMLIDDQGTPGDNGDDFTVCDDVTLAAAATVSHRRSVTLTQTTTNTALVTGRDPLRNVVSDDSLVTVIVQPAEEFPVSVYLPIIVRSH